MGNLVKNVLYSWQILNWVSTRESKLKIDTKYFLRYTYNKSSGRSS